MGAAAFFSSVPERTGLSSERHPLPNGPNIEPIPGFRYRSKQIKRPPNEKRPPAPPYRCTHGLRKRAFQHFHDKTIRDSYILNDYVNARAVHTSADQEGVTYGFDGKDAWHAPADVKPSVSPRFWSLTPYYFVGLPFVLADEGINFEPMPDAEWEGTSYQKIKVTYDAGTGDADGDYYVLWINPETMQVDALNYIVSYPGFFKDGGHLPEKLMVLDGKVEVEGITLPTGYTTRWSDKPTEVITNITVSDYAFRPETKDEAFAQPTGAVVVTDLGGE